MHKSKRDHLAEALAKGMIGIVVDATQPGVVVPGVHRKNVALVLNLSYRFEEKDLVLDKDSLSCTLTFGSVPSKVTIPYKAVSGYFPNGEKTGFFFGADSNPTNDSKKQEEVATEKRPAFRLIKGGKS